MTRVLVTGGGGFLGSHVAHYLASQGMDVVATLRRTPILDAGGRVQAVPCDIRDSRQVEAVVTEVCPQLIVHMAAQSLLSISWEQPELTMQTNVLGTLHLINAIRRLDDPPLAILAGTSAEYSPAADGQEPITETAALEPMSPYGVSKVSAGLLARMYARLYGLRIIWIRPFQIIGPRKWGDACSDFARGIVAVERGLASDLPVGDLRPVRDFLDVRDAVRAVELLVVHGAAEGTWEAYNICSGTGRPIRALLDGLLRLARSPVSVREEPARIRPVDQTVVMGDNSKLRALGWRVDVPIADTLADVLEYWRSAESPAT